MQTFYHVTKLSSVGSIAKGQKSGLRPSSGVSGNGMSADSQEAYKYTQQDKNLIYLWTDEEHTSTFKKSGVAYAMIIATVDDEFVTNHMWGPKSGPGQPITGTTAVCDAPIPVHKLTYKKSKVGTALPLTNWGVFSVALDGPDKAIWGGEED